MLKVHVLTTEKLRKSTHQAGRLCKMSATVHKIPKHSRASLCHQDSVFHRISILVFSKHARTTLRKSHLDWLSSHKGCCCLSNKKTTQNNITPKYRILYVLFIPLKIPSSFVVTLPLPSHLSPCPTCPWVWLPGHQGAHCVPSHTRGI